MKTIGELKTLDLSGYFFKKLINIQDLDPEYIMVNDFEVVKMLQCYLIYVILIKMVYQTLLLTILNASTENLESIVI